MNNLIATDARAQLARRHIERCECGETITGAGRFCSNCGVAAHCVQPQADADESRAIFRRLLAEAVDRLLPLPFLAYLFPPWVLVVVLFHLICDGSPSGRSPGKWIFRLRVVSISSNEPCGVWRSFLRRVPTALGQAAYCFWVFVPVIFFYEIVSLAFVWLNPAGRRFEDYLAGTRVISESQYRRSQPRTTAPGPAESWEDS